MSIYNDHSIRASKRNHIAIGLGCLLTFVASCNTPIGDTASKLLSPLTNLGVKQTLETEVDEIQTIRQELEGEWSGLESRVATVEQDVVMFGKDRGSLSPSQWKRVGEGIKSADPAEAVEASANSGDLKQVGRGVELVGTQAGQDAARVSQEGRRIMGELKAGIPGEVGSLSQKAAVAAAKAAEIRYRADNLRSVAEKNDLMTDEDLKAMEANHRRINEEVNALVTLADRISREGAGLSDRLADSTAQFQNALNGQTE